MDSLADVPVASELLPDGRLFVAICNGDVVAMQTEVKTPGEAPPAPYSVTSLAAGLVGAVICRDGSLVAGARNGTTLVWRDDLLGGGGGGGQGGGGGAWDAPMALVGASGRRIHRGAPRIVVGLRVVTVGDQGNVLVMG